MYIRNISLWNGYWFSPTTYWTALWENRIFWFMGKKFCVEFHKCSLKFHSNTISIRWNMCSVLRNKDLWAPWLNKFVSPEISHWVTGEGLITIFASKAFFGVVLKQLCKNHIPTTPLNKTLLISIYIQSFKHKLIWNMLCVKRLSDGVHAIQCDQHKWNGNMASNPYGIYERKLFT